MKIERTLVIAIIALLGSIGLLFISSAFSSQYAGFLKNPLVVKQIIFILLGIALLVLFSSIDYSIYKPLSLFAYIISVVFLFLTLFVFRTVKGRWISLGFFSLQPSEFAKLAYIIYISHLFRDFFLNRSKGYIINLAWFIVKTGIITFIPFILVLKQPDLGTSLVFPGIWLILLMFVGTGLRLIGGIIIFFVSTAAGIFMRILAEGKQIGPVVDLLLGSGIFTVLLFLFSAILLALTLFLLIRFLSGVFLPMGATFLAFLLLFSGFYISGIVSSGLKNYQKNRIRTFIDPYSDIRGSGWNVIQSKISIGSGGFAGKGLKKGTQNRMNFLPERHTDFIFSLISEEWGFRGSVLVLFLQGILLLMIITGAMRSLDVYGFYLSLSVFLVLFFHTVMNIGMNIGVLPVTGIPLPFVSYGGSFFISGCVLVGMVLNVLSQGGTVKRVGAYL